MAKMLPTYNANDLTKRTAKTSTDSNSLVVVGETIAVTAAQAGTLNLLLGKGVYIPKNAEIAWVMIDATDMDTNGSPLITLSIGDAASNARLLAANTIAQTGAAVVGPTIAKTGFGYSPTADTQMGVYVAAAAATGAAGTVKYAIAYVSQG